MIVVSDATPLIALARLDLLDLLKSLYGTILIPDAVYDELIYIDDDPSTIGKIKDVEWIKIEAVENEAVVDFLNSSLDRGESAAIALAIEKQASLIILDEAKGRRVAEARSLNIIGTVGIVITAKREGLIENAKLVLDALIADGFYISENLYQIALRIIAEEG